MLVLFLVTYSPILCSALYNVIVLRSIWITALLNSVIIMLANIIFDSGWKASGTDILGSLGVPVFVLTLMMSLLVYWIRKCVIKQRARKSMNVK